MQSNQVSKTTPGCNRSRQFRICKATLTDLMELDLNVKFNMKHGMWTTGTNSPYELIIGAKKYSTKDILNYIKCPTLVLEGEKDDSFPGQPKKVYEGLISLHLH